MRRRELLRMLSGLALAPALPTLLASTPTGASRAYAQTVAPHRTLPVRQAPEPNNIVGLNLARLHQPIYIWAASDLINANGGDWGYITVVWTIEDRQARNAEYDLQMFLDRCFEFEVQPIVRVATRFEAKKLPTAEGQKPTRPNEQGAEGSWSRPEWDEPKRWRDFFETGTWPSRHAWIVVGNEPNLGREWGGEVDAASYARYLAHFLDVFGDSSRFDVVGGALDISNTTELPVMQDALEFLDGMEAAVPGIFERLPAWTSNPYRVLSRGPGVRYTHLAYEAELDHIGREMPVLITEAGHLDTGDDDEIARFYEEAFRAWMADPKVIAATPLFWHPDRNDFWMFELDKKGAFVHKSPTYELLRRIPRVKGSPNFTVTMANTARTVPFETVAAAEPEPDPGDDTDTLDTSMSEKLAVGAPPSAAAPTTSGPAPAAQSRTPASVRFRVANTDGQGARLRAAPSRDAELVAVLPDGAVVQALGPERKADDLTWRQVRAADGAEGWIATDLLEPAGAES